MVAGFVWEYVIPLIDYNSITDIADMVCYFIGTITYYFIIRISMD